VKRSRWSGSWRLIGVLAFLGWGCAVDPPYGERTAPPEPLRPLLTEDVTQLLLAGFDEDAILERVRDQRLATRITHAEIQAWRNAGASDRLILTVIAAAVRDPEECPPMPTLELPLRLWLPCVLFPGPLPIPFAYGLEGHLQTVSRPERIEP
jgi:hypothetical protein